LLVVIAMRFDEVNQLCTAWSHSCVFMQQVADGSHKQFRIAFCDQLVEPGEDQLKSYLELSKIVEARKVLVRCCTQHRYT